MSREFSPLDQIRQAEAESTRRIAAAQQAADHRVAKARRDAIDLIGQAREAGIREGQTQYEEIIARAEEDAKALLEQAHRHAVETKRNGDRRMELAVRWSVNLVLGLKEEG